MAFGLQVTSFDGGGNAITQIDTELGLTNYVVTKVGTGFGVDVSGTSPKSRIIFVKPSAANLSTDHGIFILAGTHNGTIQFVDDYAELWADDGMGYNEAYLGVQVDYMIVEDVTGVTPEGDYGLQTLTSGNEAGFDSRRIKLNSSFDITSVVPAGSIGGYGSPTNDFITNDSSKYISINWSFWDTLGSKAGLKYYASSGTVAHIDVDGDEPDPTEPHTTQQPTYYDNYANILIADKT